MTRPLRRGDLQFRATFPLALGLLRQLLRLVCGRSVRNNVLLFNRLDTRALAAANLRRLCGISQQILNRYDLRRFHACAVGRFLGNARKNLAVLIEIFQNAHWHDAAFGAQPKRLVYVGRIPGRFDARRFPLDRPGFRRTMHRTHHRARTDATKRAHCALRAHAGCQRFCRVDLLYRDILRKLTAGFLGRFLCRLFGCRAQYPADDALTQRRAKGGFLRTPDRSGSRRNSSTFYRGKPRARIGDLFLGILWRDAGLDELVEFRTLGPNLVIQTHNLIVGLLPNLTALHGRAAANCTSLTSAHKGLFASLPAKRASADFDAKFCKRARPKTSDKRRQLLDREIGKHIRVRQITLERGQHLRAKPPLFGLLNKRLYLCLLLPQTRRHHGMAGLGQRLRATQ